MKKRCLITGCEGFIGSYLAEYLVERQFNVYGLVFQETLNLESVKCHMNIIKGNVVDKDRMQSIIEEISPDFVFHLAAQSLIPASWKDPEKTFTINILGTLYLLESIKNLQLNPVIEITGSSDEYGTLNGQIQESAALTPSSPYGVSKMAQDMLGNIYSQAFGMKIVRTRPFSVIGPRKELDACSDFARGIAEIEAGKKKSLRVGNLEAVRDFVDVRDAAEAMWMVAEKGSPGQVYNICSGKGKCMKDILNTLTALSSQKIKIVFDPQRMRPSDKPLLVGDNSKIIELGWHPEIPLEKTLADILEYWRGNIMKTTP
jgi:GDP-4-dehydro-6-deoxy-D-mannose reductase